MKLKTIAAIGLLTLLAATSAFGQVHLIRVNISHEFTIAGKVLPAGQYSFAPNEERRYIEVSGNKVNARVPILTRLAAGTNPKDARLVFDEVGNTRYLAEIWMTSGDGFMLRSAKEKSQRQIIDVSLTAKR